MTWITYNQPAADGYGIYDWNTTGVTPGTYYIGGYLYAGGKPTYSHLTQPFQIGPVFSPGGLASAVDQVFAELGASV